MVIYEDTFIEIFLYTKGN